MTATIKVSGAFAALRYHNYRLWFVGQLISLMGTWMQAIAQGWLVYEISGSRLALGTIAFLGAIPTLFLMLPAGALADRIPKQRLLIATQTVMMLCAFTLTILAATHTVAVWHIGVLAVILGIAQSFDAPTRQAMAVEMVEDRNDLSSAIALNSMMFNLARVAGPAIGGIILAQLGAVWCFALNGFSFLAVIIGLALMRFPPFILKPRLLPLSQEIMVGLRYVWNNIPVRSIVIVVASSAMFGMTYAVLLPAIAADVLRVGETGLGYLSMSVGMGALLGSLTVASLGRGRRKGALLTIGNLCLPAALLIFSTARTLPFAMISLAFVGWAHITQNVTANMLVQMLVPDDIRGRVMGVYMLVFFGGAPINSLQAGIIGQALGANAAIAIGAGVALVVGLGVLFFAPAVRKMS